MSLFRKVSGFATSECFCYDSDRLIGSRNDENCDIRLACYCGVHYDCLVKYIQLKVGDRLCMSLQGIECPYGRDCNQFVRSTHSNSYHYLSQADLHGLVDYGDLHPELNESLACEPLTHEKVNNLTNWIIEEELKVVKCLPVQLQVSKIDDDPYILASTKACPNCSIRTSHYHGHSCHHISPAKAPKRGGCPSCHVNYCYKCLKTETENIEIRGIANCCECGYWSNFCAPFRTMKDLKHLKLYPVPYDKRCGCVICPDCSEGKPCEHCPGNCVVCVGILRSGPLDLTSKWKPKKSLASWDCLEFLMYNLFESCRLGDHNELHSVLDKAEGGLDINTKIGDDLITPLHYACSSGNLECIKILLNEPLVDINSLENHGLSPIQVACWKGALDIVIYLSEKGADHSNYWGLTTLHLACEHGHLSIVKYLIETNRMDLNSKTAKGRGETPLHYACRKGHLMIVKYLLDHNIDVNTKNAHQHTPLHRACEAGNFEIIRFLIQKQANIDTRVINYTAYTDKTHKLLDYLSILEYCQQGQLENVIRCISNYPELLYARDVINKTPLHIASEYNYLEMVHYLSLDCNDINIVDKLGNTPLHYASQNGHFNIVKCLIKHKANVEVTNLEKQSPLHVAYIHHKVDIIKYLIKAQFGTNIDDDDINNKHINIMIQQPIRREYNLKSKKKFFYKQLSNKNELSFPEMDILLGDI